jgi:cell division transport system permease protein
MFDRLEFLLTEAFVALRRNLLMTFAAVTTAAVSLFLLGSLGYVYFQLSRVATEVSNKFEMRVWLKDKISNDQAKAMMPKVQSIKGVRSVVFVAREEEWKRFQVTQPELTKGWDASTLPNSFRVTLKELDEADAVAGAIRKMPEVLPGTGVVYLRDEQQTMDQFLSILRLVGGLLGGVLFITAGILIYNAIRLTIFARRREIRIMQLVGATKFTVRVPFMIEGAVQGLVGGLIATGLIMASQAGVEQLVAQVTVGVQFPKFPVWTFIVILGLAGGAYGAFCSYLAIREPLRYRSGVQI